MTHSPASILIVEDEPIIAGFIRKELRSLGYTICGHARNYEEAIALMAQSPPDLALVDIALGGSKDGIHFAHALRETGDTPLIFLTSFSDPQTIERAKPTRPDGYVVKPFTSGDLYASIELALSAHSEKRPANDAIFLPDGYGKVRVDLNQILFIESRRMYLDVHSTERCFTLRSSLSDFLTSLPPDQFVRIHRSIVVNQQRLSRWTRNSVWIGDQEFPIGRTYQTDFALHVRGGRKK